MSDQTARQVLIEFCKKEGLSIPFGPDGPSIRGTCRKLADQSGSSAAALRKVYYKIRDSEDDSGEPDEKTERAEHGEEPPGEPLGLSVLDRDYFYNEQSDLYIVWLPHRVKPLKVEGDTVREMKSAYSNMPNGYETINEISTAFGWRRKDFHALKRAFGWTHDEDPYTDEDHATQTTESLVQDYSRKKRAEFERELKKKEWAETIEKAQKFDDLNRRVWTPFVEHATTHPPRARDQIDTLDLEHTRRFMAVFSPADTHLHKLSIEGRGVDFARQKLAETTERLIGDVARHGAPERVVLVLGNDWWHFDNDQGTTSAGTPQDLDGNPDVHAVAQGYEIAVEAIDRVRALGVKVEVLIVPSNHGRWSDYHLHSGLRFGYREHNDVDVICCPSPRQYIQYGRNQIGFDHGDGAPETELPLLMAKEEPQMWAATRWRYWLTAHRHHLYAKDRGVLVMQAPSLAGTDRYHDKKGFTLSEKANVCYLFDHDQGHFGRPIAFVD